MQGLFSGVWALSSIVGPAAGGLITDFLSWRWVFYINIPFGLASVAGLFLFYREQHERQKHGLDIIGTVSLTVAVVLLLLALLEGTGIWGWQDVRTLTMIALSATGLLLFLWQERRAPEPMLPLTLFRNPVIAVSSVGSVILGTILFCAA